MPIAFKCGKNDRGGCGFVAPDPWLGRCPGCGGFFDCRQIHADIPGAKPGFIDDGELISLRDAASSVEDEVERLTTGIEGVDYIACKGGLAKGAVYLFCGDPGVGKTTLLLQALDNLAQKKKRVTYVTGEMSIGDLYKYASRLKLKLPSNFTTKRERDLHEIIDLIVENEPDVLVVDSISVIEDSDREYEPGSAAAIRSAITELHGAAEEFGTTIIIIAHVTKEGILAGPKALEHLVDVFLYFQGSPYEKVRFLKCESKNRHGETPRSTRFMMTEHGLVDCFREDNPDAPSPSGPPKAKSKTKAKAKSKKKAKSKTKKKAESLPEKTNPFVDATRIANINQVLDVVCKVPDCDGKKGVACSVKKGGARFHEWRVEKVKTA